MKPLPPAKTVPPSAKIPSRIAPTPDKPVVPGEGKEEGKQPPEGVYPKAGSGESKGKEAARESSKPGYREGVKPPGKPDLSTREKLFDQGVIGETAMKKPGVKGGSRKDDAITFDTAEYRFAGYMRKLKEKIESIWEYPADARKKGLYGDLRIRFTIKKDGRLGAIELLRTSGYKSLDDAAMKALKDGEPYWPLPDEWQMESYTISGHFIYTMYGYGIQ
jgi:protein TonB